MAKTFDMVLKGGTIVNQDGEGLCDLGIKGGRIAALGTLDAASAGTVVDCTGLHVLPGVIDTQVHFREPGLMHKEDLETGSLAAVMGGVTTVFEMPNTELKELERLPGAAGVKVFMGSSTGSLLVEDDAGVEAILSQIGRRAAFHSEDEMMLRERRDLRVENDPMSHPVWRSAEVAMRCTERLVRIARKTGARIHVLHISTAEEMRFLAKHKDVASCEVTPHHLTLVAPECYERLGTLVQMNPPVRDLAHRDGLWWGVAQGVADILGSDHAPHTLEEKAKPYPASPSGMTGVQTLVPIMLDHVTAGRMSLERFVDMTSAGPARLFGIAGKGRIAVGYDADVTVVDLKRTETIRNSWIASRSQWTPYDGVTVTGWPVGTIIRGNRVMWEGELVANSQGEVVRFSETLAHE